MYSRLTQSRLDGLEPIVHIYRKTEEEFVNLKFDLFDSNDQQFDAFYQRLYQIFNEIDVRCVLPTCISFLFSSKNCTNYSRKISIEFFILHRIIPSMPFNISFDTKIFVFHSLIPWNFSWILFNGMRKKNFK